MRAIVGESANAASRGPAKRPVRCAQIILYETGARVKLLRPERQRPHRDRTTAREIYDVRAQRTVAADAHWRDNGDTPRSARLDARCLFDDYAQIVFAKRPSGRPAAPAVIARTAAPGNLPEGIGPLSLYPPSSPLSLPPSPRRSGNFSADAEKSPARRASRIMKLYGAVSEGYKRGRAFGRGQLH